MSNLSQWSRAHRHRGRRPPGTRARRGCRPHWCPRAAPRAPALASTLAEGGKRIRPDARQRWGNSKVRIRSQVRIWGSNVGFRIEFEGSNWSTCLMGPPTRAPSVVKQRKPVCGFEWASNTDSKVRIGFENRIRRYELGSTWGIELIWDSNSRVWIGFKIRVRVFDYIWIFESKNAHLQHTYAPKRVPVEDSLVGGGDLSMSQNDGKRRWMDEMDVIRRRDGIECLNANKNAISWRTNKGHNIFGDFVPQYLTNGIKTTQI